MGSCCRGNCPADGSRGGMSDGCGKTCGCPSSEVLYGGSCCTPNCPTNGTRGGMSDCCGQTWNWPTGRVAERLGAVRRELLHAELPQGRHLRRQRRLRREVRLHGRRDVHERDVPDE